MSEQGSTIDTFKNVTGFSIGLAVLTIVLGFIAISVPYPSGPDASFVLGTIFLSAGLVWLIYASATNEPGTFIPRMLIAVANTAGGIYLATNHDVAVASLTFVVAAILIAVGALQIVNYFQVRSVPGSGWILFDGIMTATIGLLVAYPCPDISEWGVGALVGFSFLFNGFTRLMYSIFARSVAKTSEGLKAVLI